MTSADAVGAVSAPSRRVALPLAMRFALREMRGGLRGFYVFLACIALGTGAIAAVNSLARGMNAGIAAEGQSLLGGDVSFSLIHRRASPAEIAFLRAEGRLSTVATLRAMARTGAGAQTLVEVKGVDGAYPLYGDMRLGSGRSVKDVLEGAPAPPPPDGETRMAVPAAVDASLLATARLRVGDTFEVGRLRVRVVDTVEREPDRLSGGIAFGPRIVLPIAALERSGLVGTGSLVRWHYRVAGADGPLPDAALRDLVAQARERFPAAGWRIETRAEAAPGLRQSIDQFAQFLTLVGLTSLAVGGVGVANAVRAFLERKRTTIATLRALGASGGLVVRLYLVQIMLLAAFGVALGLALGAAAPPLAGLVLADALPVSGLFTVFPGALALAALYGGLTALTFSLLPLARAHSIGPLALMRDDPLAMHAAAHRAARRPLAAAAAASALALAALAIIASSDRLLAALYVAGAAAAFALLRVVALAIMALARAAPRPRPVTWRMALANIHRRGALTPTVTLSLGLSLTLLVTLGLVDGNVRHALTSQLPEEAPSFFFLDIRDGELDAFLGRLRALVPQAQVRSQPMLRGRIVSINAIAAEDWPAGDASWVLRGDRGITYAAAPPPESTVVEGAWWPPQGPQRHEVSFAADLARDLGVRVGDTIRVNVLGREVEATVSNLRTVAWESLSINFVMVFSPNVFAQAPHGHLATLVFPGGGSEAQELRVLEDVAEAFPTVTSIRVKEALEAVNGVVADLVVAVRATAAVALVSAVLVLAGTLAASHRSRIYDAVILKTLGARRRTLLTTYGLEYALLGVATAAFAVAAGTAAAWFIATRLMELSFVFLPGTAVSAVLLAVTVTVGLGLVGTWRALGRKPAAVLRAL